MTVKDSYKADVYRFYIESCNNLFDFEISNVISWDLIRLKMNRDDIKGLAEFLKQYLVFLFNANFS